MSDIFFVVEGTTCVVSTFGLDCLGSLVFSTQLSLNPNWLGLATGSFYCHSDLSRAVSSFTSLKAIFPNFSNIWIWDSDQHVIGINMLIRWYNFDYGDCFSLYPTFNFINRLLLIYYEIVLYVNLIITFVFVWMNQHGLL